MFRVLFGLHSVEESEVRYQMDSCIRLACYGSCRGKVRCAHCGKLVCPNDIDEDGLCDRCEEVKENDNEEE